MSDRDKKRPTGDYAVGYACPPNHSKFGSRQKQFERQPKSDAALAAETLQTRLKIGRNGAPSSVHAHEAALLSWATTAFDRRSSNAGAFRAVKAFLKQCEKAGMFDRPPQNLCNVIEIPYGLDQSVVSELVRRHGRPPWPKEEYASIEAEHARDLEDLEKFRLEYMRSIDEPAD